MKKIISLMMTLLLAQANAAPTAQVKHIPQRADDLAWENNRVAFRIYGPKLAVTEPAGSGVDVWVKSVSGMIIDQWYAGGDYHRDHGEGLDFYSVGRSRGCGGLGVWDGQKLRTSGHWSAYTIRETGLDRAVFDVEYAPWEIADGKKISERRTITLAADSHLNQMTSRLSGDAAALTVGIGIAKGAGGELWQDKELGIIAYWQKPDAEHGVIGCAVLVDPLTVSGFAEDELNHLILVNAKTGEPFTYRAGACWDRGDNAFKTFEEWKNYLREHAVKPVDWHRTRLKSPTPDNEALYLSVSGSGKPDVLERWWHGKRVRWLDERGTLTVGDLRGDQVFGLLQVDMDGDGFYDGPDDMNIKWCDTDGDGIPDTQAIVVNPTAWGPLKEQQTGHPVWMLFINHDRHGVLGWIDWEKFFFHCWDFTGVCNWLPNYHGNCDFVKTHAPAYAFTDARLNWENPFSFYDMTGNGVSNMAIRWCAPVPMKGAEVAIPPALDTAFVSYDLDGNAGAGNETSYDMTLTGRDGQVSISGDIHPLPNFAGDPKFDPLFYHNEWRRVTEVVYLPREKSYATFFNTKWKSVYFTFDEDNDDHRWERVEMLYPTTNYRVDGPAVDIYSTARFNNKEGRAAGLCGGFQSDTVGDRGEFDLTNRGGGKLYVGNFDRKLHLHGADWGAWTVDRDGKFHGGAGEPTRRPEAVSVSEVVKYTDTDGDGFIDLVEFDYNGDRAVDFTVDLKKLGADAQRAAVIDPAALGWQGLHELFNKMAQDAWVEALMVYRAAWKRDLTTPEMDKLAAASSLMQRYQNAYWLKELIFRAARERGGEAWTQEYIKAYYTGDFVEAVKLLEKIPTE